MKKAYYAVLHIKNAIIACKPVILTISVIFVLPPMFVFINLRYLRIFDTKWTNFIVLGLFASICISLLIREGWNWKRYFKLEEIKKDLNWKDIKYYAKFTVVGIMFLVIMKYIFDLNFKISSINYEHVALVLPVCISQVLSFQEYLAKKLRLFTKSKYGLIILIATFFTIMHVMFKMEFIVICFFGGIGFSFIYGACPNLILMGFSHSILNLMAGFLGAFDT